MIKDVPNDKRAYGRVNTEKKVTCRLMDIGSEVGFESTGILVKNISPGGIFFELGTAIPEATMVRLELQLPLSLQRDPSFVSGKVVRCVKNEKTGREIREDCCFAQRSDSPAQLLAMSRRVRRRCKQPFFSEETERDREDGPCYRNQHHDG